MGTRAEWDAIGAQWTAAFEAVAAHNVDVDALRHMLPKYTTPCHQAHLRKRYDLLLDTLASSTATGAMLECLLTWGPRVEPFSLRQLVGRASSGGAWECNPLTARPCQHPMPECSLGCSCGGTGDVCDACVGLDLVRVDCPHPLCRLRWLLCHPDVRTLPRALIFTTGVHGACTKGWVRGVQVLLRACTGAEWPAFPMDAPPVGSVSFLGRLQAQDAFVASCWSGVPECIEIMLNVLRAAVCGHKLNEDVRLQGPFTPESALREAWSLGMNTVCFRDAEGAAIRVLLRANEQWVHMPCFPVPPRDRPSSSRVSSTCLHYIASQGHVDAARAVCELAAGVADWNVRCSMYGSPIVSAIMWQQIPMLSYLLSVAQEVGLDTQSLLAHAAFLGKHEAVRFLLGLESMSTNEQVWGTSTPVTASLASVVRGSVLAATLRSFTPMQVGCEQADSVWKGRAQCATLLLQHPALTLSPVYAGVVEALATTAPVCVAPREPVPGLPRREVPSIAGSCESSLAVCEAFRRADARQKMWARRVVLLQLRCLRDSGRCQPVHGGPCRSAARSG